MMPRRNNDPMPWWAWALLVALATAPMILNAIEGVPTW